MAGPVIPTADAGRGASAGSAAPHAILGASAACHSKRCSRPGTMTQCSHLRAVRRAGRRAEIRVRGDMTKE